MDDKIWRATCREIEKTMLTLVLVTIAVVAALLVAVSVVRGQGQEWKSYSGDLVAKGAWVTFVGCMPREVPGARSCATLALTGYPESCVVVSVDGYWRATLNPAADNRAILDAMELGVSRQASPFGPSRQFRADEAAEVADVKEIGASLASLLNEEMETYTPATVTQKTGNRSGAGVHFWVPRSDLELKWQVPGGLVGVHGWTSTLYRGKKNRVFNWTDHADPSDNISEIVKKRSYHDGAVFADVLRHMGKVFAVRIAEKNNGKWERYTAFRNRASEPANYAHVKSSMCASCHDQAGSGGYDTAMVPGGDGVLSEDMHDEPYRGPVVPFGGGFRRR